MSSKEEDNMGALTALEIKILPILEKENDLIKVAEKTGLKDIEVQRAAQWLSNKGLAELSKKETETIALETNGLNYKKNGFPEKTLLKILTTGPKTGVECQITITKEELNASIGILKRNRAINIEKKGNDLIFSITKEGNGFLNKETEVDKFIKKDFPLLFNKLKKEEQLIAKELLQRKNILRKDKKTTWFAKLTEKGKKLSKKTDSSVKYEDKLTSTMLKSGSWKNTKFRSYDVESKVPKINRGRKHFVNESVEYIKSIWLEMGFEEMEGAQVQSAFWDLDSLFVPQDHPARELQDTFYLEKTAKLPKELLKKIKAVHENGGDTGSKGWETKYSEDIAKQTLLRTHTTVISARTISKLKKEELPKKFFIVGKVFRNEALDWKHLFEFQQVEGIVVDPNGTFAQLKGYLKEFFGKMGYTDVRIRPAYFPYTEPSAEAEAYNPHRKQWVEMGGCGIFRPEVTKTLLGFECPVLAWGLGMERIISAYHNINDLREIYKNDIEQLRNAKTFLK